MGVVMFVADQDPLARPAHAMLIVMLFQPLQSRQHRGILFGLVLLGSKVVIAEGVEADRFGLVGGKGFRENGAVSCRWVRRGVFFSFPAIKGGIWMVGLTDMRFGVRWR